MITSRSIVSVLQKIHIEIGLEGIKRYFSTFGGLGNLSESYRISENLVIFAKTGNIRNNSNISGYLLSKKGNWYCFSLMINHFEVPDDQVKLEMGSILEYIFQKG
jgi:D-alanyl-D-alanine carboxypeptidase